MSRVTCPVSHIMRQVTDVTYFKKKTIKIYNFKCKKKEQKKRRIKVFIFKIVVKLVVGRSVINVATLSSFSISNVREYHQARLTSACVLLVWPNSIIRLISQRPPLICWTRPGRY